MKTSSPPPAPDPYATAAAQTGSNIATGTANTILSNPDSYTPYGTTKTTQTGWVWDTQGNKVPTFRQDVSLSDGQQRLYDQQTALGIRTNDIALSQADKIGGILGTPVSASPQLQGIGATPTFQYARAAPELQADLGPAADQSAQGRQRVEDALYARLNPQLDRTRTALETQLVNQGLTRGTAAFNAAMDEATRQENDAHLAVTAQGGQEQSRILSDAIGAATFSNTAKQQGWQNNLTGVDFNNTVGANQYNLGKDAATFNNTVAQQGWQNDLTARTQPINEISALMGLGQVTQPQAQPYQAGQIAGTPVGQYVYQGYQGQLDAWKAQQAAQAQTMGGLFGLGSSLASAATFGLGRSDRRLKRDIVPLGLRSAKGFELYSYRMAGEARRQVGVMADEVRCAMPWAVLREPDGFDAVLYGEVM